jgi:hypothetical protein
MHQRLLNELKTNMRDANPFLFPATETFQGFALSSPWQKYSKIEGGDRERGNVTMVFSAGQ